MKNSTNEHAVVGVFASHLRAEAAIKALQEAGMDMKTLSIVGKNYQTEEHAVGYYTAGDRMLHWGGIYAPKGTPAPVLDRVAQAMLTAFKTDAALRAQFEAVGSVEFTGTRAEFERFVRDETQRLSRLVADSKMTLD